MMDICVSTIECLQKDEYFYYCMYMYVAGLDIGVQISVSVCVCTSICQQFMS